MSNSGLTSEQLRALLARPSVAARNPHLGSMVPASSKPVAIRPLDKGVQKPASGPARVEVIITIIAVRKRLLDDHDSMPYSFKPITDAIADSFGVPDKDPRLKWEYGQVLGTSCGTIVKIEPIAS